MLCYSYMELHWNCARLLYQVHCLCATGRCISAGVRRGVLFSDVNKDWTHQDQDKDKDQSYKDKDKDLTYKDSKQKRRQAQHSFFLNCVTKCLQKTSKYKIT